MDFERGQIVVSRAGHDKGKLYCVMDVEGDFLLLADGKTKKENAPKRKRRKHAAHAGNWNHPALAKLRERQPVPDSELRRMLAAFRDARGGIQGGNTLGKE